MPNKLLGQNFLKNSHVIKEIVAAIEISSGDIVLEIGPGHGELTSELRAASCERRVQIIAIEKDKALIPLLEEKFRDDVKIISGDVLKELPSIIQDLKLSTKGNFKIVGNIPYYVTGHLLRIISELDEKPSRCVFMVQKEVAMRIVAKPPDMSRLAASVQFWAEPEIIMKVPRKDFFPQPKVDSAVLLLKKKNKPIISDAVHYYTALRALFAQPRKTILNNVVNHKSQITNSKGEISKESVARQLHALNINPLDRPQDLSVAQIGEIAERFFI